MKTLGRHLTLVRQLETERSARPPSPRSRAVIVVVGLTAAAAVLGLVLYADHVARARLGAVVR